MSDELSDEVVDQIVFGMENQEESYYFDREKQVLIHEEELSEEEIEESGNRFVSLPEWRPVDGFHMMEQFTGTLRNPIYREELRETLKGGRGVFRRFKDLLKKHEPLEKLWFSFKEREMRKVVRRWYASITEAEEFERLGEEPEETEQLLLSDLMIEEREETAEERDGKIERSYEEAFYDVSSELRELTIDNKIAACYSTPGYTIEARTPSWSSGTDSDKTDKTGSDASDSTDSEIAGTAGGEIFSADGGDIFKLLYLYVAPAYRGMGLSRLLLDRVSETAKRLEAKELVVDVPSGSAFLERELRERAFSEYVRSYSLRWSKFD